VDDPARPPRKEILAALDREARRAGSLGSLHGKAIADRAGIHPTDFECLDVLDWTGPISAGELARHIGLTSGAITGVIDRLEQRGVVRRVPDPTDRRRVIVSVVEEDSSAWMEDLAGLFTALARDIKAVNDRFDDEQLATVLAWLRSANDAVERSTEKLRGPR
jgi:DNA-binding MarR family transcriptional regulator